MKYSIGCTITTVNTGLSCDIDIGYSKVTKETHQYRWQRISGRLDIRDVSGAWMYGPSDSLAITSIADARDPYWSNPANWLVHLYNVPERFAEKLGCGEYFMGEGKLFLTEETVRWKMWYPCI